MVNAKKNGADFLVFGPTFEKKDASFPTSRNTGERTPLKQLRAVCQQKIPILALGGITVESAGSCIQAGAAGVAGIRLFQQGDLASTVQKLRELQQSLSL